MFLLGLMMFFIGFCVGYWYANYLIPKEKKTPREITDDDMNF